MRIKRLVSRYYRMLEQSFNTIYLPYPHQRTKQTSFTTLAGLSGGQGSQQAKTRQDQARLTKTALNPVLSRLGLVSIKPLDKRSSRLALPRRAAPLDQPAFCRPLVSALDHVDTKLEASPVLQ